MLVKCKKIKIITKEKKVGHGGTLDPFAEGVLMIGTNIDTKKLSNISRCNKTYTATIKLGIHTDSFDRDGKIIETNDQIGQMLVSGALDDTKKMRKAGADIFAESGLEKP